MSRSIIFSSQPHLKSVLHLHLHIPSHTMLIRPNMAERNGCLWLRTWCLTLYISLLNSGVEIPPALWRFCAFYGSSSSSFCTFYFGIAHGDLFVWKFLMILKINPLCFSIFNPFLTSNALFNSLIYILRETISKM